MVPCTNEMEGNILNIKELYEDCRLGLQSVENWLGFAFLQLGHIDKTVNIYNYFLFNIYKICICSH